MKNITVLVLLVFAISAQLTRAQNAPVSIVSDVQSYGTTVVVPVKAVDFTNIRSCNLQWNYDTTKVMCTNVTKGPSLFGGLSVNITTPGTIAIGWFTYPGVSLADSTIIFNLSFSKVASGSSPIQWDDNGYSCIYYNGSLTAMNDLPTANYYIDGSITFHSVEAPVTIAPEITACPFSTVEVPILVNEFVNIGSLSLKMIYNSAVLTYVSFNNNSGFPGLTIDGSLPGIMDINALIASGSSGVTLADSAVLFTLVFNYAGGNSNLNWFDNGTSCEYADYPSYNVLIDSPTPSYYVNGLINECKTLQLNLNHQGLYNPGIGAMRKAQDFVAGVLVDKYSGGVADLVSIELHEPGNYSNIVYQIPDVDLNTDGSVIILIPEIYTGSYYITIKHPNLIETVSAMPVSFAGSLITYDFTSGVNMAYGNNLYELASGVYGIFTGDVNQDGVINLLDREAINDAYLNTLQGYLSEDLNGDGIINLLDRELANNAYLQTIQSVLPN